jgi:hypothetical protein
MWMILRNLYLGDRRDAYDKPFLHDLGITHIVNCAWEVPCWYRRSFKYLQLRLTDPDPEFQDHIARVCKFIHRGRKQGAVLVHCVAGLSRSPSMIVAYLCSRGKTVDEALRLLRRGVGEDDGSFIEPHASFLEQIEDYFEERG